MEWEEITFIIGFFSLNVWWIYKRNWSFSKFLFYSIFLIWAIFIFSLVVSPQDALEDFTIEFKSGSNE